MKTAIIVVAAFAAGAASACSMSSRGGSMFREEGFAIAVPALVTHVKQGEIETVTVSLHRGESFKRDVKLEARASKGISVEPSHVLVKAGDKPNVQLRIGAPKDAALGEYRVYVKGKPETGEPTSVDFKVQVDAP